MIFDDVSSRCDVVEEGSTVKAVQAVKSDKFKKAVSLMREGKQSNNISKFEEAKKLLQEVRTKISSTRTWPISYFVGNSIIGAAYSFATVKELSEDSVLYPDKQKQAKAKFYANNIISIANNLAGAGAIAGVATRSQGMYKGFSNILNITSAAQFVNSLHTFIKNKSSNPAEAGKWFNNVCAVLIRMVDLYIESCDLYIRDIEVKNK